MKKRNYNIDILRAAAILWIVLYHSWVQCGAVPFRSQFLTTMVSLGGEVGVTAFFALSGYGIYCSLYASGQRGERKFLPFIKKRLRRLYPQYALCLFGALLLTDGAAGLGQGIGGNLLAHLLLVHNWFPAYFGAVNGVLWTMGVIFQFYLIAIPLFWLFEKLGAWVYPLSVAFTVALKAVVYHLILPVFVTDASLNFFAGRQLFTSLDNFVAGMLVAHLLLARPELVKKWRSLVGAAGAVVLLYVVCRLGQRFGIHTDNFSGYVWHSAVALALGGVMWFFARTPIPEKNPLVKGFLWISRYEYEIYLWHLLMINNLLARAPLIQTLLAEGYRKTLYLLFVVLCVLLGYGFGRAKET